MSKPKKPAVECSKHLLYEIEMFFALGERFLEPTKTGRVLDNASLEAFLVHARLLYYFFCCKPQQDDIGITKHFGRPRQQFTPTHEKHFIEAINKRVAHLSEKRVEVGAVEETWDTDAIVSIIGAWVKEFSEHVCEEKVKDDFKCRVRQCTERYRDLQDSQLPTNRSAQSTAGDRTTTVTKLDGNPDPST